MKESKYEKYLVRGPTRAQHGVSMAAWSKTEQASTVPPYMFLEKGKPIEGVKHMAEFLWVWKDTIRCNTPEKPPHKHNAEEIFMFLGTNKDDPDDLGAEIEFWMGEGEEAEKLEFSTSSLIYVPRNVTHMPIVYKNVKKPVLVVIVAPEAGDLGEITIKCPTLDI